MFEDLLWEQAEPHLYISKDEFLSSLVGWNIEPHRVDGAIVGVVLTRGHELHFATFGEKWKLTRAGIRHYLAPILAEHGVVTTKTPIEAERQHRFNRVLGFEETSRDEFFVHYALRRLPFSRSK